MSELSCFYVTLALSLFLAVGGAEAQEQNPASIQEALIWAGYYRGPLDGNLGSGSIEAIKHFQAKLNRPATGNLAASEWSALASEAARVKADVGFRKVIDQRTGIEIGIPTLITTTRRDAPHGSDYISPTGDILVAARRYRVSSDLPMDFEALLAALPSSSVEYKVQKPSWFVVAGSEGQKRYYIRFHRDGMLYSGFYSIYDQGRSDQFAIPQSMMSFTLDAFAVADHLNSYDVLEKLPTEPAFLALSHSSGGETTSKRNPAGGPLTGEISPKVEAMQPPSAHGDDSAASKLLLDSIQQLLARSTNQNARFIRYTVDKSILSGFRSDMPVLRVVYEERVFFDTNKTDIRPEALTVLDSVAVALRTKKGPVALFVAGHADARGSDAYNLALSVKRAESVARALEARGVGSAMIWRVGFGKAVPLKPTPPAQNMAYNRRVEFLIASQSAIVAAWIKSTKTLCESPNGDCGGLSAPTKFEAVPIGGSGLKPVNLEVPARPAISAPTENPTTRPALPAVVPSRPSLRELVSPPT